MSTPTIHRIADKAPEFPCEVQFDDSDTWHPAVRNYWEVLSEGDRPVRWRSTTSPTPPESAPQSAPAQGETPRIYEACLNWDNTGDYRKRLVSVEYYEQLKRELNEAKAELERREHGSTGWEWRAEIMKLLVALGIKECGWHESFTFGWGGPFEFIAGTFRERDTLRAQVAQLTGAQDRMDAEIAMLTADLFRATSERDQARQDLEERCAENDRERAAHLQAYQEACKERDEARAELPKEAFASNVAILELQSKLTAAERELAEAKAERDEVRQWLAERPSTELYQRAVTRNEVLCAKLTAATEEAERLRERTEKLRNQRDLAEAEADTLRQQLATSQDWGEKARKAIGLALDQIDDQRNASESAGRCIDRLTALLFSYPAQGMEGRG